MNKISVEQLKEKRDQNHSFILLDVREPHEYYMSDLEGTTRIPLDQLQERAEELNRSDEIIIMCRSGNSASDAQKDLIEKGFENTWVLDGGINKWAERIDPSMPQY
jgi:rhodanese-related sulfurtransferase